MGSAAAPAAVRCAPASNVFPLMFATRRREQHARARVLPIISKARRAHPRPAGHCHTGRSPRKVPSRQIPKAPARDSHRSSGLDVLHIMQGSARASRAASDALVVGIRATMIDFDPVGRPRSGFGARAHRTTGEARVLPISPANWKNFIPMGVTLPASQKWQ